MTLYRGPGGTGSATSDADTTLYQDFLNQTIAARDAALQAEINAELAETNAETAEANAETAETNAAASASAAATSASNAASSASSASSSASAAAASASEAAGYAASINPADLVHISGTETITGAKTFSQTITGSITGNAGTVTNGVYTTGDQTIAGTKTFSSNPIVSSGVANGVCYLNGSKVLTTGSALTFDGTNFATTGTTTATRFIPSGSTVATNGMYLPAANTLGFSTNSTNAVYIDSSQNVGIGTSSPDQTFGNRKLTVASGVGIVGTSRRWYLDATKQSDALTIGARISSNTVDSDFVTIDSSGNVGIGTSSPTVRTDIVGASGATRGMVLRAASDNGAYLQLTDIGSHEWYVGTPNGTSALVFGDGRNTVSDGTERMRIDSSGNLLVGTTSADAKFVTAHGSNSVVGRIAQTASSGIETDIFQVTALNHATSTLLYMLRCYTSGPSAQFAVRSDGVVYAQNTAIQSISDARVKENVRNSEEGLQTVLGLRPVRFDFKEGFGNNRKNQLGFIAQEVEAVFPDAVDAAGEEDEQGEPYKSVGPGAMIPVLVKAIQEQQAIIEQLKADVAALKGA